MARVTLRLVNRARAPFRGLSNGVWNKTEEKVYYVLTAKILIRLVILIVSPAPHRYNYVLSLQLMFRASSDDLYPVMRSQSPNTSVRRYHDDDDDQEEDLNRPGLPEVRCDNCGVRFSDQATLEDHRTFCGTRAKIFMPYDPPANGYIHNGFPGLARSQASSGDISPGRDLSDEKEEDLDSEADEAHSRTRDELDERPDTPGFKRKLGECSPDDKLRSQIRSDESFILGLRNRMVNSFNSFRDRRLGAELGDQGDLEGEHSLTPVSKEDLKRRRFSGDASGSEATKASSSEDSAVTWALKLAGRGLFGDVNNVSLEPLAATRAAVSQQGMLDSRAGDARDERADRPRQGLPDEVNVFRSMLFQFQQQQFMQIQMIQQMRRQLIASGLDPKHLPADMDLSMMSSEGLASVGAAMSGLQNAAAAAAAKAARSGTSGPVDLAPKGFNFPDLISSTREAVGQGDGRLSGSCSPVTQDRREAGKDNSSPQSPSSADDESKRQSRTGNDAVENDSKYREKGDEFAPVSAPSSLSSSSSSFPVHSELSRKYLHLSDNDLSPFSGFLASASSKPSSSSSLPPPGRNPLEILQEKTAASLSALPLPGSLSGLRPPLSSPSTASTSAGTVFPGSEPKPLSGSSSLLSSSALFASSPSLSALQKETDALKPSPILPPISLPMTPEAYKGYIQRGTTISVTKELEPKTRIGYGYSPGVGFPFGGVTASSVSSYLSPEQFALP
ncbi:hypothetical protein RRG08_022368 [Elysia crispata]|uniref:Uncharacterized protein n=1 Tax=Elysia crispata TaxID=231223 RepID=A0AAE0Z2J4_9GAST|nr:hypothetical protein RRG08_022368 [Elysia crispata]